MKIDIRIPIGTPIIKLRLLHRYFPGSSGRYHISRCQVSFCSSEEVGKSNLFHCRNPLSNRNTQISTTATMEIMAVNRNTYFITISFNLLIFIYLCSPKSEECSLSKCFLIMKILVSEKTGGVFPSGRFVISCQLIFIYSASSSQLVTSPT